MAKYFNKTNSAITITLVDSNKVEKVVRFPASAWSEDIPAKFEGCAALATERAQKRLEREKGLARKAAEAAKAAAQKEAERVAKVTAETAKVRLQAQNKKNNQAFVPSVENLSAPETHFATEE